MTAAIKLCLVVSVPSGNIVMDITLQTGWRAGQGQPLSDSAAHPAPAAQPRPPFKQVCRGCAGIEAGCSHRATMEGSPGKSQEAPTAGPTPRCTELSHGAAGGQRQGGRRSPPGSLWRIHHRPGRAWARPAARTGEPGWIRHAGGTVARFSSI